MPNSLNSFVEFSVWRSASKFLSCFATFSHAFPIPSLSFPSLNFLPGNNADVARLWWQARTILTDALYVVRPSRDVVRPSMSTSASMSELQFQFELCLVEKFKQRAWSLNYDLSLRQAQFGSSLSLILLMHSSMYISLRIRIDWCRLPELINVELFWDEEKWKK